MKAIIRSKYSIKILAVSILGLGLLMTSLAGAFAQAQSTTASSKAEQQIITLSKDKWQWMADKNVDSLAKLFDEKSVFVHMGGSWGKIRKSISSSPEAFITRKPMSIRYR